MCRFLFALLFAGIFSAAHAQAIPDSMASADDSLWLGELKTVWDMIQNGKWDFPKQSIPTVDNPGDTNVQKKPLISFHGGYVRYNLNYRSRIDTPFNENDIVQHSVMTNMNITVNERIPLSVTYYERQSNSALFKDFRDVVVNVNPAELQRLRNVQFKSIAEAELRKLKAQINPGQLLALGKHNKGLKDLLTSPVVIGKVIQAKEKLLFFDERDKVSKYKDSVKSSARNFVQLYDSLKGQLEVAKRRYDSLDLVYQTTLKKIQGLTKLSNRPLTPGKPAAVIIDSLRRYGIKSTELEKHNRLFNSLKTLSFGRTIPDISPLTVKNINVKGINAAFSNDRYYFALTAGVVDFRLRDFIQRKSSQPSQYVYAFRGGIGSPDGSHVYVTAFKGKKAIYSFNKPAVEILGTSLELQYAFHRLHRLKLEVAQSSAPSSVINGVPNGDLKFDFRNQTGRAYNIQLNSIFPKLRARLEGFYQSTGVNFQAFNSYRVNSTAQVWSVRYEQHLFHQQLRLVASARRNDFENPFIAQRYNSNTVFKTIQATFRRKKWPAVSIGYIPASQYTVIDSQIYESRYQTFTSNLSYDFHIGRAGATMQALYSKFFNSSPDTGFIYYQAQHLFVSQRLQFELFATNVAVTVTRSPQFALIILQGGYQKTFRNVLDLEFGFKVNNLNQAVTKVGTYAKATARMQSLGDISIWYDNSYLPSSGDQLFQNEQLNIGYTRRFK